ncbi:MAG TPA: ChaN family lipoprotein [Terriglobales bacterium]|jgi:heme-binding uptake protein ChaN (Tiki superfamily)|nr:ChaN family lipoprotein [Terriglobales bacterium]
MASASTLRWRRSAAQLHALVQVEREIRATDPNSRRKYLRDYSEAFRTYQAVLTREQLESLLHSAGLLLIGDYHALPASQRYAACLMAELAANNQRPLVLGLETIFARDQHIVDEWMRGEIEEEELRERIRFDLDWGYQWEPFYELLAAARSHGVLIYGLDCMPRDDLRKIAARDRHAAEKIAELRLRHPEAQIGVLFGESHLAPNHIPELLRRLLPEERVLTVLQNVDPLYWKAAGERREQVEAVKVREEVICVFNSTPLEKYESYRLCLDRWSREGSGAPDFGPTVYNLIDGLARFLNINACSAQNGRQPKFLVDQLPEVYCRSSDELLHKLLQRRIAAEPDRKAIRARLAEQGSAYLPAMNSIYVTDFQMVHVAEEAASFLHHACRGSAKAANGNGGSEPEAQDRFYSRVLEHALAYFGSRVLYPARPPAREAGLYALYAQSQAEIESSNAYSYAEYMRMLDFLVLHKDYEGGMRRYLATPALIEEGVRFTGSRFDFATRELGYMLGTELYDAYVAGRVGKRFLRSLFFHKANAAEGARDFYFTVVRRIRRTGKRPV